MILEGLITTIDERGEAHIAAMGALVDERMEHFALRPYQSSRTFRYLKNTKQGVLHVTDDVEMLVRATIHQWEDYPRLVSAKSIEGFVLAEACRWYAFQVTHMDARTARTTLTCQVREWGKNRDFFGFNRGKHAVVEAAILASRCDFLGVSSLRAQFRQLAVLVQKTGGVQERQAFDLLHTHVQERLRVRAGESDG